MPSAPLSSELQSRTMPPACTRFCGHRETSRFSAPWKRRNAGSQPIPKPAAPGYHLLLFLRPLVSFLQISPRFFQRAKCVVVGLQRLPVLVDRTLALPGDVENFPKLNAAPDLGPPRIAVAVDRLAVGVGRRLVVPLQKENFRDPVMRQ